jgi:hypothetical protein
MKTYINNKGEKQHFVGAISAGWREMTANELQQEEQAKQLMTAIKTELSAIYEAVPSLLLKAQYKPIKAEVEAFIEAGEIENAEQFPNIIKRIGTEESPMPIYPLAGSNYLTWFIDLGEPELDIENFGFNPSIDWVRNLISPVDVMDDDGLIPSFGYEFKIYRCNNNHIPYNNAFYEFDYYSGFIFFVEGRTPKDSGNGLGLFDFIDFQSKTNSLDARNFILENAPRSTSFQYVGNLFSDIKYGNGLTFSQSGELSLNIDQESGLTFSNGKLAIDIDKISIKIDKDKGLTFSEETGELQINSSNGLTFSADGALLLDISDSGLTFSEETGQLQINSSNGLTFSADGALLLDISDSGLTFSDNKLAIITDDTLKVKDGRLFVSGNSVYEIRNPLNTLDNNSPTGVIISFTPLNHSTVKVFINGQSVFLGITTTGVVCYFSGDGGNTAKEYQDIVAGDELYFNSNFTGYSLSSDDSVVLIYESNL